MGKKVSVYLNMLRVMATFVVFMGHFGYEKFSGQLMRGGANVVEYLHDAVIIFFVLSGYVITYVACEKEKSIKEFFASRVARIYSALVPALILTLLLDKIGSIFSPEIYTEYMFADIPTRFFANLFCVQQIWNANIRFMSNGPLWSIGYEVIYYVIFGLLFYGREKKSAKILALVIGILFYKVLLLFPVWLLGSLAYKLRDKKLFSIKGAYITFGLTIIVYGILKRLGVFTAWSYPQLGLSCWFIGDYILGILIFINILCVKEMKMTLLMKVEKVIDFFQKFSFSIYLFHFPLFMFFLAVFKYNVSDGGQVFAVGILALVICYVLSLFTERNKYVLKKKLLQCGTKQ